MIDTRHEPECPSYRVADEPECPSYHVADQWLDLCICDQLRAAMQRVLASTHRAYMEGIRAAKEKVGEEQNRQRFSGSHWLLLDRLRTDLDDLIVAEFDAMPPSQLRGIAGRSQP